MDRDAQRHTQALPPGSNAETNIKDSNPKDAIGIEKAYASTVPRAVIWELGLAMLEGALKYGRHNYREIGVRASVYYDADNRHMDSWWEGEDDDPDSGLSHVTKAIASLVVLRDAMIQGKWVDDRPPRAPKGWLAGLNAKAKAILAKFPVEQRKAPFTEISVARNRAMDAAYAEAKSGRNLNHEAWVKATADRAPDRDALIAEAAPEDYDERTGQWSSKAGEPPEDRDHSIRPEPTEHQIAHRAARGWEPHTKPESERLVTKGQPAGGQAGSNALSRALRRRPYEGHEFPRDAIDAG